MRASRSRSTPVVVWRDPRLRVPTRPSSRLSRRTLSRCRRIGGRWSSNVDRWLQIVLVGQGQSNGRTIGCFSRLVVSSSGRLPFGSRRVGCGRRRWTSLLVIPIWFLVARRRYRLASRTSLVTWRRPLFTIWSLGWSVFVGRPPKMASRERAEKFLPPSHNGKKYSHPLLCKHAPC